MIFSIGFIEDFQKIPIYYSNLIKKYTDRYINLVKKQLQLIKSLSYKVKLEFFHLLKNIDIPFQIVFDKIDKLVKKFEALLLSISFKYQEILRELKQKSNETRAKILTAIKIELSKTWTEVLDHLRSVQMIEDMFKLYKDTYKWVTENVTQQFFHLLKEGRRIYEEHFSFLDELSENLKNQIMKTKMKTEDIIMEVLSFPFMKYMLSLSEAIVTFSKDTINLHLKSYNLRSLMEVILSRVNVYISTTVRLIDFWYNSGSLLTYKFEYDSRSYIRYKQVLPIYWSNFGEMPSFLMIGSSPEETTFDMTLFYIQAHDFVRELLTAISTRSLLPPFSATAMIVGDNQIQTFDGRQYTFTANCSYLLLKDFNHERFSVVANFENSIRRSIDVKFGNNEFKMKREGKILWNRKLTDLPIIHQETYIAREGNKLTILNEKGLRISCNIISHVCIFKISGWYFGKVGGLLGVYDNEASNDLMTSELMIADEAEDFLETWKTESLCAEGSVVVPRKALSEWDRKKCIDMFRSDSSRLTPCFGTVDPEPYLQMCFEQMSFMRQNPAFAKGFCQVAGAYIEYCKVNNVEMWLPGECYSCPVPDQAPIRGMGFWDFLNNTAPKNSDVVLVLQHGPCIDKFDFKTIINLVESSLQDEVLTNNRYSVIGFGGPGQLQEPHSFTSLGDIFTQVDYIPETINR